ncbi:MAG: ATP-binding protein [Sciscionella sp.]
MTSARSAVHRSIVVVDVEGFGDQRRTTPHQLAVRAGLYRVLRRAFDDAGVSWAECRHEDRGDGVFILAPAQTPKAPFVDSLPDALVAALRKYNDTHPVEQRFRLRMALHAGEVAYDEHGVTAAAVTFAFRLVDAAAVKTALAESAGVLALVTSGWFFDEVVRHSSTCDPATFRPVRVAVKETNTVGWVCRPDDPYPSDTTALSAVPRDPGVPVPRQLPPSPRWFTGRAAELAALSAALDEVAGQNNTVVISALGGTGGIGKTWLALRWAHEHLTEFPDGQLFVDLHGYAPTGGPVAPARAVRGFLDALGVDSGRIPVELDAQVALFRSLVAGRRLLIVLDNARDTSQVISLLPGSPSCTVLVTSRDRLAGLVTGHGARPLPVDVLSEPESRALLLARLGAARLAAEPDAVGEVLACCAGFPLALSVVAARAQTHPELALAVVAAELRETATRLGALDEGDPAASVPAVLSWSTRALTPEQGRVFGLLGIAPGPDISLPAAASLTALPTAEVGVLLRGLERVSLVQQGPAGRWWMHDLVRLHATDHAHHTQPEHERNAALRRLAEFYTHTAHTGDRLLSPHREPLEFDPPVAGCYPRSLDDAAAGLGWFDAEHPCLLATQRLAAARGWHATVWRLAWTLTSYHHRRGRLHDNVAAWQAGLAAAPHLPEPTMRIQAYRLLGDAYARVGRHEEAMEHLQHALTLAKYTGELTQQAHTHHILGWAWERRGQDQRALEHTTHALHLFQILNEPVREARALNAMGWCEARLGRYAQGRAHCEAALTLHRRHHDRGGEAATLDSLGYLAHHTGEHTQARDYYQHALTLYRDLSHTYDEADTLDGLGHTHAALGDHQHARAVWQQALQLYQAQYRSHDADRVQHQLDTLNQPPDPT